MKNTTMKNLHTEFESVLSDFAKPGNRWNALPRVAWWAKSCGMDSADIIAAAHSVGVRDRDADIRRSWESAHPQPCRTRRGGLLRPHGDPILSRRLPPPQQPPTFPDFVRGILGDHYAADSQGATFDWLREMSPCLDWLACNADDARCRREHTRTFLAHSFAPDDMLFIDRSDIHQRGVPGANIRPCREWLEAVERGEPLPGDLITPNPLTGKPATKPDGSESYSIAPCLARFPFVIVEFDSMPLNVQIVFWRYLLLTSPLAAHIAAIAFSDNKSLHALLHVGCATIDQWQSDRDRLRRLLASDPDPAFRADAQAMQPLTKFRLPGATRRSNRNEQTLLYLDPAAVTSSPLNPKENQP